jgi:ATP-dependent RNA helicase DOB1
VNSVPTLNIRTSARFQPSCAASARATVVGEFAVHLAVERATKCFYTTPIKALSNQKFREFTDEFGDVGLLTGDVTINENATCLVRNSRLTAALMVSDARRR